MLGAQVQEAMATTGVHYLQRFVLRHVVTNEQQGTQRMSEVRTIVSLFARVPVPLEDVERGGAIDLEAHNRAFAACHECVESLVGRCKLKPVEARIESAWFQRLKLE
jgi:hypothetical protein